MRNDPSDSELCLLVAVANFDLVSNLHFAPAAPEFYTMVADIQSMCQMTSLTPGDPEAHRHDRFCSFRPSFHNLNVGHVPFSIRVTLAFISIAIISVAIALVSSSSSGSSRK